jgi:hypothetical protein
VSWRTCFICSRESQADISSAGVSRPRTGEHTPIGKDGTVDISPSARFCISEAEIVTALYLGLKKLKVERPFVCASACLGFLLLFFLLLFFCCLCACVRDAGVASLVPCCAQAAEDGATMTKEEILATIKSIKKSHPDNIAMQVTR